MKKLLIMVMSIFLLSGQTIYAMSEESENSVDQSPSSYHCEWNSQSTYPVLQTDEITTVWVKFKNTGTATWYNNGSYPVHLGTSHNIDRASSFYKHTWLSTNRPANLKESKVEPGKIGTFEFYIKAPATAGTYKEYFQPVVEGLTWLEDYGVYWEIKVEGGNNPTPDQQGYHAAWYSQNADSITLATKEVKTVWVKFKNTGTSTWYNYGPNPIHLGTDNPRDHQSGFYQSGWLSTNRASNLKENSVAPGSIGTFEFSIQAPNTTGAFTEYFTPVAEGLTWIGANGVYWNFNVQSSNNNPDTTITLNGTAQETGGISLYWSKVPGISGYKVVRSETNASPSYPNDWWIYISGDNNTEYIDSSAINGHKYYYRIGAYDANQGVIGYSNSINLTAKNYQADTFTLSGTAQSNGNKLTWTKYSGISGYKIVRSETDSSPTYPEDWWVYVTDENTTDYIDTSANKNTNYYYRVGAYISGTGVVSYTNNVYLQTVSNNSNTDNIDLNLYASNESNGIRLSWDNYTDETITGYKVLRSISNTEPEYPDNYLYYVSGVYSTDYLDTTVNNDQKYYYRIGLYNDGEIIGYSEVISITANKSSSGDTSFNLTGNTTNSGVQLNWDTYEGDNISGYKVVRSESTTSPTYPSDYIYYVSGQDSIGYVDTSAKSGHTYYYRIGAYKNSSVISYSNYIVVNK